MKDKGIDQKQMTKAFQEASVAMTAFYSALIKLGEKAEAEGKVIE